MSSIAQKRWVELTNAWLFGAVFAAVISLYYSLASAWGETPMLLPGLERHQSILFFGRQVIRSGCFHEGNFAALFFLLSIALSLHRQKFLLAFFLSLACLSTFSSLGVVGCVLVWGGSFWAVPRVSRKRAGIGAIAVGLTIVFLQCSSGYLNDVIVKKLFNDKVYQLSRPGVKKDSGSLGVRVYLMKESLRLWRKSPLFGIGLSQFGYHYRSSTENSDVEKIEEKPIPNNVYLEILAETGILGFLAMTFFSFRVIWAGWKRAGWSPLFWGVMTCFLGLNTFPSFSVLFIWIFLALWVESPVYGEHE
ncbi:MAG: O-antigen ligase family protein [Elusimicrobia bacterium]|nr:O-antigen ligase family protein [Elusimicrobiota bacterium]